MGKQLYRIKVETIGNEEDTKDWERVLNGEECEGFVLLLKKPDGNDATIIHKLNTIGIAQLIEGCKDTMQAALIADGIRRAKEYGVQQKAVETRKMMLGGILG